MQRPTRRAFGGVVPIEDAKFTGVAAHQIRDPKVRVIDGFWAGIDGLCRVQKKSLIAVKKLRELASVLIVKQ